MTDKKCQCLLTDALGEWRPSLSFNDIVRALEQPHDMVSAIPFPVSYRRKSSRWIQWAIAACLLVMVGAGGVLLHWHYSAVPPAIDPIVESVNTIVAIDVNPGIELSINQTDQIAAVEAVNSDGQQVLDGLNLNQQPISAAVQDLFQSMITHGYVADEENLILVTVQNADPQKADRIHAIINDSVDAVMSRYQMSASVTNQTVEAFDAMVQFAEKHGITKGKAAFVLRMVEQQPTLEADALADYSFAALAAIAQHQEIPLSELVDYDAEDGLWNLIVGALSNEVAQAETSLGTSLLTPERARSLALQGLQNDWIAENALFVRVELIWEKNTPVYRLEFVSLGYLYEYAINAIDGSFRNPGGSTTTTLQGGVIRSTLAGGGTRTDINTSPTKPTTVSPSVTETTTPTGASFATDSPGVHISDEEAKGIAFSRFEITQADVSAVSVARLPSLLEQGVQEISVRFIYNEAVHVFYIHSINGNVIRTIFLPLYIDVNRYQITEREAQQAAISHTGLQESDCGECTITFWVDENENPYITVGFTAYNYVYSYRISGVDGTIAACNSWPAE